MAPMTNSTASSHSGTFQLPSSVAEYPATGCNTMAAICPDVFIVAATVAEFSRPMSTQVLQAGAVVSMHVAAASAMHTAATTGVVASDADNIITAARE